MEDYNHYSDNEMFYGKKILVEFTIAGLSILNPTFRMLHTVELTKFLSILSILREMDIACTDGDFNPLSQHAINSLSVCSASPTNDSVASDSNKVTILLDNYVPLSYPKLDFTLIYLHLMTTTPAYLHLHSFIYILWQLHQLIYIYTHLFTFYDYYASLFTFTLIYLHTFMTTIVACPTGAREKINTKNMIIHPYPVNPPVPLSAILTSKPYCIYSS